MYFGRRSLNWRRMSLETISMSERVYLPRTVPETHQAIRDLNAMIERSGLEKTLIELVKTRASQINGCAFCIDLHLNDHENQNNFWFQNAGSRIRSDC